MVKIETAPFTEKKIDDDLEMVDFVYTLHSKSKRWIKHWIKEHQLHKFTEEEIMYIHRYPKDDITMVGILRLKELDYFI